MHSYHNYVTSQGIAKVENGLELYNFCLGPVPKCVQSKNLLSFYLDISNMVPVLELKD